MIPKEMRNGGSWLSGDERLGQNRESEYLGAEDIDEGSEPILTISGLWFGRVTLQRGKENKDVLVFQEESVPGIRQVRPLIVNSTNRKTLRKLFGDARAATLTGKTIQLYVDHNVRDPQDGGTTDGIRIRPHRPRVQQRQGIPRCTDCNGEIRPAAGHDAAWMVRYTMSKYTVPLCAECAQKRKGAARAQDMQEVAPGEKNAAEGENEAESEEETEVL